jgi:hypothetical protein
MKNNNGLRRFGAIRMLAYAKYAVAGAIGGVAIYNTYLLVSTAMPTQSIESIAMGAGAVIATGLAKILHVV